VSTVAETGLGKGPGRKERDFRWTADRVAAVQRQIKESFSSLDRSPVGEGAISALIAVVLLIGVVWNMPDAAIKRALAPLLAPIAVSSGLEQYWTMYAPDPPQRLENLEVHVTMADGGDRVWTIQPHDRVVGVAVHHRWRKLKESLVAEPAIRPDLAHWVVRQLTGPSERPVRVNMILRTEVLPPPGVSGRGETRTETLYDEKLAGTP
jgi:hypothetical protein